MSAWFFAAAAAFGYLADATPVIRNMWRWALERHMDLTITKQSSQYFVMYRDPQQGSGSGMIWGIFTARFINNSRSQKERIIGAQVALKRRFLFLWRKTIVSVPVRWHLASNRQPFTLDLEPMQGPVVAELEMTGPTGDPKLYSTMELVLEFQMVGPLRWMRIPLESVTHKAPQ